MAARAGRGSTNVPLPDADRMGQTVPDGMTHGHPGLSELEGFVAVLMARSAIVVQMGIALALSACTSSGGGHPTTSSTRPSSTTPSNGTSAPTSKHPSTTTSTSPPPDPRSTAATAAYLAFEKASRDAERKPGDHTRRKGLRAHAVDPALSTEVGHLVGFASAGYAWFGQPPRPRVNVKSIDPGNPYTVVTLVDCPTVSTSWKPYVVKGHQPVPVTYPSGSAKPPHALTATVIHYKSRWMVQKVVTDVRHTCAG